jgi:DNA-binding transcriptional MerR regulator
MDRWTLDELTARAAAVLQVRPVDQRNGQVSEVPNARTIRYYTTLGLLDRPHIEGRTALYGRRHLVQLVALKRLQSEGRSLVDVQRTLQGLTKAQLADLADLPAADAAPDVAPTSARRRGAFWGAATSSSRTVDVAQTDVAPCTLQGVQAHGLSLTFTATRSLNDDDAAALHAALARVHQLLVARALLPRVDEGPVAGPPSEQDPETNR